jgi:hypothetical protein
MQRGAAWILLDEKGTTCAGFLIRAVAVFAAGTTRIERVITDDARNNRGCHAFEAAVAALGATHSPRRTTPEQPPVTTVTAGYIKIGDCVLSASSSGR